MKTLLKTTGLFFSFVIFLSITISDKPLFSYIYEVISPATIYSQNWTGKLFNKSVVFAQKYSKKLFNNSVPKMRDSVDSKLSANLKESVATSEEPIHSGDETHVDDLIKNQR